MNFRRNIYEAWSGKNFLKSLQGRVLGRFMTLHDISFSPSSGLAFSSSKSLKSTDLLDVYRQRQEYPLDLIMGSVG